MYETVCTIPVALPFRLDLTIWALRRREKNTIDYWDGQKYSRILILSDIPVKLTVLQWPFVPDRKPPQVLVRLQSRERLTPEQQLDAQVIAQKVLGMAVDVQPFWVLAAKNPVLKPLAEQFSGVRPPRFPTIFEALVNAIACQQVSLDAGIALLNRFTETFGLAFPGTASTMHAFPRPEDVFDVPESDLKQLGFSYQKARAVKEVAYAVADEELRLEQLELATNEEALGSLQSIRGIGRWSAEYVLLRGLGRLDIFPGDDVGGQYNIQKLLGLDTRPDYEQLENLTAAWRPYAGFVYFHLLLSKLHDKGLV